MEKNLKELRGRIRSQIPYLTSSQKIVANYIVENPQKFALSSVRELERELQTSKSTVVRLAQALGYEGFHEMKSALLKSIRHELDPINRFKTYLSLPNNESDYLKLIAEEAVENINSTLQLIARDQFNKAVDLLKDAPHVYTLGLGISNYLAEIAAYLLNRVSIRANYMTYAGVTFAEQIVNLSKDDVIMAFTFPPYSHETIEAARYARERRLTVISMTDKATSRIVHYSDVTLQVIVESMTISNSIMSALTVLYAIAEQIGHEVKHKTLQTLKSIEHVRKEHSSVFPSK